MSSLEQAFEVRASITEYLKATFTFKDKKIEQAFIDFIENPNYGMFKGPYISLKLPFVKADPKEIIPLEIKPDFLPFHHQVQAFKNLTTQNNNNPRSTILTTGTGSGKTEAFLYPILDYCYKNQNKKGIKAIILYPMNALATDQAKRIADIIFKDERLKNKLSVGLFIGEGRDNKNNYPDFMGIDHIIENRETILNFPTDILLTNFKMLDYALMRSQFHKIWKYNLSDPELIKFLVLDELHTYDGAQGTDVANLIRRLKLKLNIPLNNLCPIGTSATIGKGEESKELLANFASTIFGEDFSEDSIVEESRITIDEFFNDIKQIDFLPTVEDIKNSILKSNDGFEHYIKDQKDLWKLSDDNSFTSLSESLLNLKIVKDIILLCNEGIITLNELVIKLKSINRNFNELSDWDDEYNFSPNEILVRSIITLIAVAKIKSGTKEFPFIYSQIQIWIRELSGVIRTVNDEPEFKWREEINMKSYQKGLPAFFCRECGASGWIAEKHENKEKFELEINDIYEKYFSNHKNIYFVTPYSEENIKIDEYDPTDSIKAYLNKKTLTLSDYATEDNFRIIAYRKLSNSFNVHICPQCNSRNTLNIIGTRVSTLSSVSISQILATDLDPNIEKYRKILAFSNGVQDAAYRSGFIEARNYRFTFRTALQKVINIQKEPINLLELWNRFIEYWSVNADEEMNTPLEAYFYKFFPSDHSGDIKIKDFKKGKENFDDIFYNEFNNRIGWEIFSEFGYNAKIGRTLEKTFSTGTFFSSSLLTKVFELIQKWLEDNTLGNLDKESFLKFLLVFLHRLRIRGGLDHIYLHKFRTGRSSYYLITQGVNKMHFLIKNFGRNTRLPKLITDQTNHFNVFDLTTRATATNWYHTYFTKAFPLIPNNIDLVNDFFKILLETLSSEDVYILNVKNADGIVNFAIEPEKLFVNSSVDSFICDVCGNSLVIGEQNNDILEGAKCISYRCSGKYEIINRSQFKNYYQQVYNRGRAPRIYSSDHTGLLERKKREDIEIDFKTRPKFNSKNVLVATSTLEMGIDIGDLNSAINTSVPPLPSNFMQRIGRAGRASGSALIVNLVSNEAHELYYYEDPKEMMEGEINTPGCYLEANEILKRHFFAYCIDSWTSSDPDKNEIPSTIRFLKLESLDINNVDFVINRIISFIKSNENILLDKYIKEYKDKVSNDVINELKISLRNESFYEKLRKTFLNLKEEILNLRDKLQSISDEIKMRNLTLEDPERIELDREYRNISNSVLLIRKRQVLEHLTNEGILPNYAFPETGVTLKALIRRRSPVDSTKYDLTALELVRPSKSAIRELVPDNFFYSQGYKMKIDGLNIINWKEEVYDYRYCSRCDHIDIDVPPILEKCPKCGDGSWASTRNRHKFLKLKAVSSFNDESQSKLDDTFEERESKFSNISRHFTFEEDSIQGSLAMIDIPFGIEFFKKISLTEINTGLKDSFTDRANITIIKGNEIPVSGYIVCRVCGKASSSTFKERGKEKSAQDYHFGYCRERSSIYSGVSDEVFEQIFLFRNLETEALRILLPVQEFNTESSIQMFKAGISLGLKKYYRGNPDHIDISDYSEFNQQTQRNDRYLVLYDIIPGGTGYLGKLFDKNEFNLILKSTYENIRDCNCKNLGKDGCYKCIFTYANKFEREDLSRKKAEEIFERIYNSTPDWEYSEKGLNKITNSGKIEESELEERFIRLLESLKESTHCIFKLTPKTEDGITKYLLKISKGNIEYNYEVKPQVTIGPSDGAEFTTISDFMITCISYSIDGIEDEEVVNSIKPIATYLDGYQYHASEYNNSFITDIKKRNGIIKTNKYLTWTITWEDLNKFEKNENDELNIIFENSISTINHVSRHPIANNENNEFINQKNNLSRLLWYLQNIHNQNHLNNIEMALFSLQSTFARYCFLLNDVNGFLNEVESLLEDHENVQNPDGYLFLDTIPNYEQIEYRIFKSLIELKTVGKVYIKSGTVSYNKKNWNLFWILYNLFQFDFENLEFVFLNEKEKDLLDKTIEL